MSGMPLASWGSVMGRALGDGPWQRKGGEEEPVMFGHEWWGGEGRREQVGSKVDCREKIRALVRWRLLCWQSSFSGDGLYAFSPAVLTTCVFFIHASSVQNSQCTILSSTARNS